MFRAGAGEQVAFGDLVEASWLFALELRRESVALAPIQPPPKGRTQAFAPQKHQTGLWVLGFGDPQRAVLLDDDCHLEGVFKGRGDPGKTDDAFEGGGRVLLAAVRVASPDEMKLEGHFALHPLVSDPDGLFVNKPYRKRALIDLTRIFTLRLPDEDAIEELRGARIGRVEEAAHRTLKAAWSARSVRRGPMVATDAADKLARILSEAGHTGADAVPERLTRLLSAVWYLEGAAEDAIGDYKDGIAGLLHGVEAMCDEIETLVAELRTALP
jgi:hypothetical protein